MIEIVTIYLLASIATVLAYVLVATTNKARRLRVIAVDALHTAEYALTPPMSRGQSAIALAEVRRALNDIDDL